MRNLLFYMAVFSAVVVFAHSIADGQSQEPKYVVDERDDAACELNSRHIDSLVLELKRSSQILFIISRRNAREKSLVDRARLSSAVSVLTAVKDVDIKRIVTGAGDPVSNSKGRLEFYLGSELFLVSYARPSKHVCLTCCPEG